MFNPGLSIGQILKNSDIVDTFKCGNMGGMRRSKTTNTLVLISDYTKGIYHDKWIGGILHYTGMGKNGDQDINWAQNATLANYGRNGVDIHLFEVMDAGEYIYCGRIELVTKPYVDTQPGEDGQDQPQDPDHVGQGRGWQDHHHRQSCECACRHGMHCRHPRYGHNGAERGQDAWLRGRRPRFPGRHHALSRGAQEEPQGGIACIRVTGSGCYDHLARKSQEHGHQAVPCRCRVGRAGLSAHRLASRNRRRAADGMPVDPFAYRYYHRDHTAAGGRARCQTERRLLAQAGLRDHRRHREHVGPRMP